MPSKSGEVRRHYFWNNFVTFRSYAVEKKGVPPVILESEQTKVCSTFQQYVFLLIFNGVTSNFIKNNLEYNSNFHHSRLLKV